MSKGQRPHTLADCTAGKLRRAVGPYTGSLRLDQVAKAFAIKSYGECGKPAGVYSYTI